MKTIVELNNISYKYDKRKTAGINKLNLKINKSECLCLIGPSGSGKTTTAKIIAKLLSPQDGTLLFKKDITTSYVPQTTQLPEEKTVFDFLKEELFSVDSDEKKENLIRTTLALLNITNEIHNKIKEISGGQRQRVIIARALITMPQLIILDEPFGHLDEKLRQEVMQELFSLFKDQKIAVLWVTHETREALSFSDKIVILNHGSLQQEGSPHEVYCEPKNLFVSEFFGENNIIAAKLLSAENSKDDLMVKVFNKEIIIPRPRLFSPKAHNDVLLIIRPENVHITKIDIDVNNRDFSGKVNKIHYQGSRSLVQVKLIDTQTLFWLYTNESQHKIKLNDILNFSINYSRVHCMDEI